MMKVYLPIVFIVWLLSGCDFAQDKKQDEDTSSVTFPLLQGCESFVKDAFELYAKKNNNEHFKYEITKFDVVLDSHPDIIGQIKVTDSLPKMLIVGIVNDPILTCYPTASFSHSLSEVDFGEKLIKSLSLQNRYDSNTKYYPVINGNDFTVYFLDSKTRG